MPRFSPKASLQAEPSTIVVAADAKWVRDLVKSSCTSPDQQVIEVTRGQDVRDVVGQRRDLVESQSGFECDFILCDDGTGMDPDDLDIDAEIQARLFE